MSMSIYVINFSDQVMDEGEQSLHRVFLNSPLQLTEALHCIVSVTSCRGVTLEGALLAVDPVSDTAVLVRGEGEVLAEVEVVVVPLVDWTSMQVLDSSEATKQRVAKLSLQQEGPSLSFEEKEAARRRCLNWLKKNGLPAEEDGEQVMIDLWWSKQSVINYFPGGDCWGCETGSTLHS